MHPKEGGGGELRGSEGARRRGEVMFSMSSDVMREVCVKFMNIQDTDIKVLNAALAFSSRLMDVWFQVWHLSYQMMNIHTY